jgi:hypothetical protein
MADDDDLTDDDAFALIERSITDLAAVDTSAPRPWIDGMDGFMRPGTRAIWFAPQGEGKSIAALVAAVDVVAAGGSAAYIDLENGRLRMADRLEAVLGDRPDSVREDMKDPERWSYMDGFDFNALAHPKVMAHWRTMFAETDLVVLDSMTRIMGQLGLNEESNPAVAQFVTQYVDPITATEWPSVLLLDNTGHTATERPRGGSAKLGLFELAYRVSGGQTCSPTKHGTIRLKRTRHRDGDELVELTLGAGGGKYTRIGKDDKTADLLATVVEKLDGQQFSSKTAVYEAAKASDIKIRKSDLLSLLDDWEADPDVPISQGEGGWLIGSGRPELASGSDGLEPAGTEGAGQ